MKEKKEPTHRDLINIRVVRFAVVAIKSFLSESKRSTDGLGKLDVPTRRCQVFVNVVHGWDDGADVGCIA